MPTNFGGGGYQFALTGNGYVGCYFKSDDDYREYIQVQLSSPLEYGVCYHIGFFINPLNQWCGTNQAGLYISVDPLSSMNDLYLPVEPQIQGNGGFYSDTVAWMEISGLYPALGGEQYITIGNFRPNTETFIDPLCPNMSDIAYYYIDSVYVIEAGPAEELPLELGPSIEACVEYEIDGESGDVLYYWSNGTNEPTTTVTTSGTYTLTITEGCVIGIDSVEVTFLGSPPVDINPGFASICEGESYTVTLDPEAGDYIWNDGTTDHTYTITEPGLYSVTLDDGCNLSSDDVLVDVTMFPLPFNLGNDTILCAGDAFEITIDLGENEVEWQDGSALLTYSISAPGTYAVTISNVCGEASDEIEVTGLQEPQIDLGSDTIGWCDGDVIHYEFDPELGMFLWSDDSFDPYLFIFTTGVYSVTVTNECGTTQDMVIVYEAPEPIAGLEDTIAICAAAFPYSLMLQMVSPVDEILWSTGSTEPQISVSAPGQYTVTITNSCYTVSDTVVVGITPVPLLALPDTILVCSGDTAILDASVPSATYLWQDGSTDAMLEATEEGWYAVTVTTSCGTSFDSSTVQFFPILIPPGLRTGYWALPG